MRYQEWIELFGRTTEDPSIISKLAAMGLGKPPVIKKNRISADVEMPGLMLTFTAEALYPDLKEPVGEGTGVLTQLTISIGDPDRGIYQGQLPYDLKKTDSRKELHSRFGKPHESNETFFWDEWRFEDITLVVTFLEDWKGIELITLMSPGAAEV